eukprot:g8208.t1
MSVSTERIQDETTNIPELEAMDICRPDTPSTVSETASELQSTAPNLELPISSTTMVPRQLESSDNPSQPTKTRSSAYRGVCWNKKNKRWQAAINNGGRYVYLGSYVEELEAAKAFDLAALQIRGSNAKLNFNVEDYPESEWKSGAPPHLLSKYQPVKPGLLASSKTASGRHRMEAIAFQDFKMNNSGRPRNIEEVIVRGRSGFAVAEQEFLRDSVSSYLPIQIKKESEPIGVISGYPAMREISLARVPGICRKPMTEPVQLAEPVVETEQNQTLKRNSFEDSAYKKKGRRPTVDRESSDHQSWSMWPDSVKRQRIEGGVAVPAPNKSSLPVPVLQHPSKECRSLKVSSVLPESVTGSEVEAAKLIVGSSRNHFGLIHRTSSKSKWCALVWDGDTMHDMGGYATENDAQVACVAAVQLIEVILGKGG